MQLVFEFIDSLNNLLFSLPHLSFEILNVGPVLCLHCLDIMFQSCLIALEQSDLSVLDVSFGYHSNVDILLML